MRRRPLLAAVAVLGTACLSGCATVATAATPATGTARPGPTTTGSATPAKPTSAAPALATTGTAWPKIVTSITAYGQWLLANPNPALVSTIAVAGCGAHHDLTAELQSLVDQGAYVRTSPDVVTSVAGLTTVSSNNATVDITVSRPAETVLDRKTTKIHEISTLPQLPPTGLHLTLIRGTDSHWRLCDISATLDDPDGQASTALF